MAWQENAPLMNIAQLHEVLQKLKIPADQYYLHGLFGSSDDHEKLALSIKRVKHTLAFEVYFKEKGQKHLIRAFTTEDEACRYFLNATILNHHGQKH
ncbi:hypothetical protein [Sabulibacter ruber]|uniref:hypothetical protein n=1 Tax=Sabulibacter ruber TaxID=2811901 RepID=UPI001A97CA7E|nr:hypothetical protein [Sabulibacter ruber]